MKKITSIFFILLNMHNMMSSNYIFKTKLYLKWAIASNILLLQLIYTFLIKYIVTKSNQFIMKSIKA